MYSPLCYIFSRDLNTPTPKRSRKVVGRSQPCAARLRMPTPTRRQPSPLHATPRCAACLVARKTVGGRLPRIPFSSCCSLPCSTSGVTLDTQQSPPATTAAAAAAMDAVMAQIYGQIDGVKWFTLAPSQYSSGITSSACTVMSTEAAAALQRVPYSPLGDIPTAILTKIMQDGAAEYYNLQAAVGGPAHKSVDEVLIMPHLGGLLRVASHRQEFIRSGVFREALDRTTAELCPPAPERGGATRDRWAAVVTKFAVAVCVVYRDGDFIVFDSHGIHPATKGFGSLLCFSSSTACSAHLHRLFPQTQGRDEFPLVQQLQMDSFDFAVLLLADTPAGGGSAQEPGDDGGARGQGPRGGAGGGAGSDGAGGGGGGAAEGNASTKAAPVEGGRAEKDPAVLLPRPEATAAAGDDDTDTAAAAEAAPPASAGAGGAGHVEGEGEIDIEALAAALQDMADAAPP